MSPVTGADLLTSLGSGIKPAGLERPAQDSPIDFAKLLNSARGGAAKSGLPVSIDPGLGVELDASGHQRLSEAVDRLEASGASSGVVLIDGHALIVDVNSRSATRLVDPGAATRVDGVVRAEPSERDEPKKEVSMSDPLWTMSNDGLVRMLAG
ncbi:MAG: hypothetical protein AAGI53_12670 [Planctomycetota bacterium]